jgi:hypothetical protein
MATYSMQPAKVARRPVEQQELSYYPVASGASFAEGAFVVLGSDGTISECGANPAAILGLASAPSTKQLSSPFFVPDKVSPVEIIREGTILEMTMSGSWAGNEIGSVYGIAKDATTGYWYVNRSDTTNTRVRVIKLVEDIRTKYAVGDTNVRVYAEVLPAYRQLP